MLGRRVLSLLLAPYVAWLIFAYRYHFLDGVNLAFHEAGHLFFGGFGITLQFLGGTLGQLIFPLAAGLPSRAAAIALPRPYARSGSPRA